MPWGYYRLEMPFQIGQNTPYWSLGIAREHHGHTKIKKEIALFNVWEKQRERPLASSPPCPTSTVICGHYSITFLHRSPGPTREDAVCKGKDSAKGKLRVFPLYFFSGPSLAITLVTLPLLREAYLAQILHVFLSLDLLHPPSACTQHLDLYTLWSRDSSFTYIYGN